MGKSDAVNRLCIGLGGNQAGVHSSTTNIHGQFQLGSNYRYLAGSKQQHIHGDVGHGRELEFPPSGGGTFLSGADGTTVISSVTISNGISTAAFYYRDSTVGNPTITGASGLLTPATQSQETVTGPPPSFPPGSIARLSDGNISLVATGALGAPYRLWGSTNLALQPVTNTWTLINSSTITTSPFTNFDLTATNFQQRFYLFTSP